MSWSQGGKELRDMGRKQSALKVEGIQRKKYAPEHQGKGVIIKDTKTGYTYAATIRLKRVSCGKPGCTRCPHHIYAYAQFRDGNKVREKYLGVAR